MITSDDVVLMISNSGETHELVQIIPAIRKKSEDHRYDWEREINTL